MELSRVFRRLYRVHKSPESSDSTIYSVVSVTEQWAIVSHHHQTQQFKNHPLQKYKFLITNLWKSDVQYFGGWRQGKQISFHLTVCAWYFFRFILVFCVLLKFDENEVLLYQNWAPTELLYTGRYDKSRCSSLMHLCCAFIMIQ